MSREAYRRFLDSMTVTFDMWHDGEGYDLSAIDELSDDEKETLATSLSAKSDDWRDLEALDRIGTAKANEAIVRARLTKNVELRLNAMRYGPEPDVSEREEAILAGLADGHGSSLTQALMQAVDHPTPKVIERLLEGARFGERPFGYHAAATLAYLHKLIDSPYDDSLRPMLIRFSEDPGPERDEAFQELCRRCGLEVRG